MTAERCWLEDGYRGRGYGCAKGRIDEQLRKIRASFIGKLLEHTLAFGETCGSVTFQTNAFLDDEVEGIARAFAAGERSERTFRYLADNFSAMFEIEPVPMGAIHASLEKLRFEQAQPHLNPHDDDFGARALGAVWKFSEVDLSHTEGVELVQKLLTLIQRKSSKRLLSQTSAEDLDDSAGVGIDDLLELLPISRGAYYHFLSVGGGSRVADVELIRLRTQLAEKIIHWLHVLRTPNVSSEVLVDNDFNVTFGGQKVSKFSGSTLTRVILAIRTAAIELVSGRSPGAPKFFILDTPRQQDIAREDLARFIDQLRELSASQGVQIVYSTTNHRYELVEGDAEWLPRFPGPLHRMFLGDTNRLEV